MLKTICILVYFVIYSYLIFTYNSFFLFLFFFVIQSFLETHPVCHVQVYMGARSYVFFYIIFYAMTFASHYNIAI